MKLFLSLIIVLVTQNVLATGGTGEDPNLPKNDTQVSEAGTTATAAVATGQQAKFCKTCSDNPRARRSNNYGVLNSSSTVPGSKFDPTKADGIGK